MKKIFLAVLIFLSFNAYSKPRWKLTNMEIGGVRFKPSDTSWATNAFFDFAWTPMWEIDGFVLHGSFQITSARDRQENRFLVTSYQAFALLHVYAILAFEAGGGLQTWHSDVGGTHPVVSGNLCLRVGEDTFDRIYVGYSYYAHPTDPSNIIRAGTAFTL